ncbi:hypothetical protein D6D12_06940 [Aureobasidium pullulans]|uniref:EthD domain-containing protein n=1 Tax=Aureobasidium pullulans TaxID=5580 RepID=A0AB74JNX4_AURPU|nr:hypothetical protein D6D12_06940 [Aureobasidium pullulans]THX61741.1 hypothetical protein D6D11_02747 [Aureobasidium pullulans]
MTEEQKHFSEHYPLHVYFKVDKLRVPTLEGAIREYELAKAALFTHQEEMSLPSSVAATPPKLLFATLALGLKEPTSPAQCAPPRRDAT